MPWSGTPRRGHDHAHLFCEVSDRRNTITRLTVYAREGFDSAALLALRQLNKVWGHGGHDIQLVLLGMGQPGNFAGSKTQTGQAAVLQTAAEWGSLTPFIPTRHESSERVARRRSTPPAITSAAPRTICCGCCACTGRARSRKSSRRHRPPTQPPLRWLQFQRRRTAVDSLRTSQSGHGFRVRFNREVAGPIAAGYGAHFGLGLFQLVAADSSAVERPL